MSSETISFAFLTALVGMGIVFVFLTLLSLVMHLIRSIDEAAAGADRPAIARPPLPSWAIAAAALYLEAEDEAARHSAGAWTARPGR